MYLIIHCRLDLGSYERLDTGIIVAMISFSFIFKRSVQRSVEQWESGVANPWIGSRTLRVIHLSYHRFDIICFTKYLVGVNSQNLIKCHRLVGVNSHSDIIIGDVLLQAISLTCYHGGTHCTIVKMQQK